MANQEPREMDFFEKLQQVQAHMKAPKSLYNSFGRYNYRNAESILEAFKPYGEKYGLLLVLTDEPVMIGERYYIKAVARITDVNSDQNTAAVAAYAREADTKAGMDPAQITGAASSYARKYALNGLFLLDDTKDPDTDEFAEQTGVKKGKKQDKAEAESERRLKDKNAPIGQLEVAALRRELIRTGVSEKSMLLTYGVQTIEEMTMGMWLDAGEILAARPDKETV